MFLLSVHLFLANVLKFNFLEFNGEGDSLYYKDFINYVIPVP